MKQVVVSFNMGEYYGAVTPQIRQSGNRLSGLPGTNFSIISGKIIFGKNLPKNAKKNPNTPKRSVNLPCRLTGSKKNLKKLSDLTTRVNLVRNLSTTKELPVSTGANLLGINRTSVYYGETPVSEEELECKTIIDHLHTDNPTWGARQMSAQL